MKDFQDYKKALEDETFREEQRSFLKENKAETKEAQILATVKFAAEKGFSITAEDLSIENVNNRSLSSEDLKQVAGGEWCWSDYSCFAVSHYDKCSTVMENCLETAAEESRIKDSCGSTAFDIYHKCNTGSVSKYNTCGDTNLNTHCNANVNLN